MDEFSRKFPKRVLYSCPTLSLLVVPILPFVVVLIVVIGHHVGNEVVVCSALWKIASVLLTII